MSLEAMKYINCYDEARIVDIGEGENYDIKPISVKVLIKDKKIASDTTVCERGVDLTRA